MKGRQPTMNVAAALQMVQNNMNANLIGYISLSPQEIEREYADMTDETIHKLFVGDKITKQRDRQRRYHVQKDKVKKRRLPTLKVGDLVNIAYGRKLKKYYRGALDKATTGVKPNCDTTCVYAVTTKRGIGDVAFY